MSKAKPLLIIIGILIVWKTLRTDWEVVAPYWSLDSGAGLRPRVAPYNIYLPISPFWDPPVPADAEPNARSWDELFPRGGAWGTTGPAVVRPNWYFIVVKMASGGIFLSCLFLGAKSIARRIRRNTEPRGDTVQRTAR